MTTLLHLYSPSGPHGEGWVAGNVEGLVALRNAIDKALEASTAAAQVESSDGEEYTILVINTNKELSSPYTEYGTSGSHPYQILGAEGYRALMR